MRNEVSREIENERNLQQNEANNADVAIEGENIDLVHSTIHQKKMLPNSQMTSMRMNF